MAFEERYAQSHRDFAELMKHYPFMPEDLDGEEWRDIEGHKGYQVSNYGRVKSCKYKTPRILIPRLNRNGYMICRLWCNGNPQWATVHRLVAQAFIPNPNHKPQVNHLDGCKWNSCLQNLEWATRSENIQHAHDTGLIVMPQGAAVHNSKFNEEDIIYIRDNPDNLSIQELSVLFDVRDSTIGQIQLGKSYRFVGGKIRTDRAKYSHKIRLEDKEKIYQLYQTGKYTQKRLGKIFGATQMRIGQIIREIDEKLGRTPRRHLLISEDVREQIRSEYKFNVPGCGSTVLAKKYGTTVTTILKIVNEK